MGDRRYERRGRRRYIGLQNEILRRPWTAKRYDAFDDLLYLSDGDDLITSIEPGGHYPLGDIARLSKVLRTTLMKYQTVLEFTEEKENSADPELQ